MTTTTAPKLTFSTTAASLRYFAERILEPDFKAHFAIEMVLLQAAERVERLEMDLYDARNERTWP